MTTRRKNVYLQIFAPTLLHRRPESLNLTLSNPTGGTSITGIKQSGRLNITDVPPMTYVSSTTTQSASPVNYNTTNQQVIGIQVVTTGSGSPLAATSFTVNTNGKNRAGRYF